MFSKLFIVFVVGDEALVVRTRGFGERHRKNSLFNKRANVVGRDIFYIGHVEKFSDFLSGARFLTEFQKQSCRHRFGWQKQKGSHEAFRDRQLELP